jgi:hypothetical protein
MRALSIIGIVMSLGGILSAIVVMTETRCYCYCNDSYLWDNGSSVPDEAVGGGVVMLLISVFFLIFSIISCVVSFGKKEQPVATTGPINTPFTTYPPFQPPVYGNPGQNPYTQQYNNPLQQPPQNNPYQNPPQNNPYQNNPYQNPPQNNPYQNPNAPKNPYVNPNANPYQNPPQNNPYQNPNAPKNPYTNPNPPSAPEPPKNPYSPPAPPSPPEPPKQ